MGFIQDIDCGDNVFSDPWEGDMFESRTVRATTPPRGDIRERILDEASRQFGDRGFGATIEQIATEVGIRKSSLLYHFGSKEELREQAIARMMLRWQHEIPRLLTRGETGEDRFTTVITAVIDFFLSDPSRARLCVREAMDRPEHYGETTRRHLRPHLKLITDYIRWGQTGGGIHEDVDPELWVIIVLREIICMVAFAPVAQAMTGETAEELTRRQRDEFVRMARRSLLQSS